MRRAIPRALALALLAVLPLTGCQKSTPTATGPTDAAPAGTTADIVGSPAPSVAMTAGFKVSDVQEAEKVYREFYSALLATQRAGGAKSLPPALEQYLDKPASLYIEALLKSDYDEGARLVSKQDGKLTLTPAVGHQRQDSTVAIRACTDDRALIFTRADGATAKGGISLNYAYLHRDPAGSLVIFDTTTSSDTSQCSR